MGCEMKILKRGVYHGTSIVTCKRCESELEVHEAEWKDGVLGSEKYVRCPVCIAEVLKPGTEYRGDF
jgi:hypothetical protein